uniref:Uncharacterized protein n=1 Tax=Plectus sambesii TaxID=2011161 RepID=A0A914XRT3_9BILA
MIGGDGLFQSMEVMCMEISSKHLMQSLVQLGILNSSMWCVGKSESKLLASVEECPGCCRDMCWQLNVLFSGMSGMCQCIDKAEVVQEVAAGIAITGTVQTNKALSWLSTTNGHIEMAKHNGHHSASGLLACGA